MSEIRKRIIGTETEFGIMTNGEQPEITKLSLGVPSYLINIECFLSNGARFYIDSPNGHLEYSTPECLGITQAVHAEIAGERIANATLRNLHDLGQIDNYELNKRVISDYGETWGYHENYLVDRHNFSKKGLRILMLGHLATRNIFTGAGQWSPATKNITRVLPGQKCQDIRTEISGSTIAEKPLLNTRDQALAKASEWARLHITSGDPNISPWATFVKLGSTSLVIRLIENNMVRGHIPRLSDPVWAARTVASDHQLIRKISYDGNKKMSALNMQDWLISQCEVMAEKVDLPAEELTALKEWRTAHDDMMVDPERLVYRVDWITRRSILGRLATKHKLTYGNHNKLANADRSWDSLRPEQSIGVSKVRPLMKFEGYDANEADHLMRNAPTNTRAHLRSKIIKSVPRNLRLDTIIGWEYIVTDTNEYRLDDPYATKLQ